jgi:hypothetical protein
MVGASHLLSQTLRRTCWTISHRDPAQEATLAVHMRERLVTCLHLTLYKIK